MMKILSTNPHQRIECSLQKLIELRQQVQRAYSKSKEGELLSTPKNKHSVYYQELKNNIQAVTEESISEGTLMKFFTDDMNRIYQIIKIKALECYVERVLNSTVKQNIFKSGNKSPEKNSIPSIWYAITNHSTPQWADFIKIPLNHNLIKRVKCLMKSKSDYYRFGFKLLREGGKLFGDGSIQSMDNNFVLHIGKNFGTDEIFITSYNNGIRTHPDKFPKMSYGKEPLALELLVDSENFLILFLNEIEVYRILINKEIREQIYMLAWGDGNDFKVKVYDIEIEVEGE